MRARIDVSEIEAKTKIRAKYLRALENEEWGLLPGPTFVKSFLRTYAQALGLDGKALVEEYRLHHERPSEAMLEPIVSTPQSKRATAAAGRRALGQAAPSRGYMIAVGAIGVVIVVLIVLLRRRRRLLQQARRHLDRRGRDAPAARGRARARASRAPPCHARRVHALVALSLKPTARGVRVPDRRRRAQADPGASSCSRAKARRTFHARRFELTLGNSSVTMFVDGTRADRAALQPGDRLLDHEGLRPPAAALRASCRRARERALDERAAPGSS